MDFMRPWAWNYGKMDDEDIPCSSSYRPGEETPLERRVRLKARDDAMREDAAELRREFREIGYADDGTDLKDFGDK